MAEVVTDSLGDGDTGTPVQISSSRLWGVSGTFVGTVGLQISNDKVTWVTSSDTLTSEDIKKIDLPSRDGKAPYWVRSKMISHTSGTADTTIFR